MTDTGLANEEVAAPKYPNSFLFGFVTGNCMVAQTRRFLVEPLCARPLQYVKVGLVMGSIVWYYDYWRRVALEQVLKREDVLRVNLMLQAANVNMRVGDEDEISNLTEYLASTSTRV